jgi:hypothetical protein
MVAIKHGPNEDESQAQFPSRQVTKSDVIRAENEQQQ